MNDPSCSPRLAQLLYWWFDGQCDKVQPKPGGYFTEDMSRLFWMKDNYETGVKNNRLYRVLKVSVKEDPAGLIKTVHFSGKSRNRFASFTQNLKMAERFYLEGGPSEGKSGVIISVDLRTYEKSPVVFSWTSALLATRSYPTIRQKILFNGKSMKEFVLFFSEVPIFRVEKILPPI